MSTCLPCAAGAHDHCRECSCLVCAGTVPGTGFHFDSLTHSYWCEGAKLPSVTEIIKAAGLGVDYDRVPPAILEEARMRGQAVHVAIDLLHQDDLDESSIDPRIRPRVDAYRRFLDETGFVAVETERHLSCPLYRYAGSPDAFGEIGATRIVPDWKTVSVMNLAPVALQVAGYRLLIAREYPAWRTAKGYGLQLRADGTYRLRDADLPGAEATFLAALAQSNGEATPDTEAIIRDWKERYA